MKFKTELKPALSLIDLTPLVDVILLMLIFFLLTSDILPLKSLNIDPPELDLPTSALTTQVLVVMDAHNVIYVGSKKEIVDLETFKPSLIKEVKQNQQLHQGGDTTVVLSIDRSVEYGDFLRLFSLAQEAGVKLRLMYNDVAR
ncbi:MAG: Tol-Pal system protein TolR [Chlamydiales bacterium]|nr:Tol-Pal system protein TolR [Chlamydiales bacterium]MCH9619821.1 Tol-Pal system protein TolR [Chlamydiales bacterium]MCH9622752.1 Tol-Pal system protein TolR [Chlamydiales bacterium]